MFQTKGAAFGAVIALGLAVAPVASAQSTDGYHAIQVVPVVVDTASFSQRLSLHNPSSLSITIWPMYYPAEGTAATASSACNPVVLAGKADAAFTSLRQLCPQLGAGSHFGALVLRTATARTFAVHSRVSNPAGAGFSVEAFPAKDFARTTTVVTGLRRQAATASSPAYQSNCFVGQLDNVSGTGAAVDVTVQLRSGGAAIGSTVVPLVPGKLVRLLDVFAAVGATGGDYDNAVAEFTASGRAGVMSFCTVQDNTSFGADFRIGKQLQGTGVFQNQFETGKVRDVAVGAMVEFTGLTPHLVPFQIQPGPNGNTHVMYFRHPDVIGCSLTSAQTGQTLGIDHGLEMRLISHVNDSTSWEVLAGGDMVTSFSDLYLGDKHQRGNGGDSNYMIQVESNGFNEGAVRPYRLRCQSGSGHTLGDLIQVGAPVSF